MASSSEDLHVIHNSELMKMADQIGSAQLTKLGLLLEFTPAELETIESQCKQDTSAAVLKLLTKWMANQPDGTYIRGILAEKLVEVKLKKLADEFMQGKLSQKTKETKPSNTVAQQCDTTGGGITGTSRDAGKSGKLTDKMIEKMARKRLNSIRDLGLAMKLTHDELLKYDKENSKDSIESLGTVRMIQDWRSDQKDPDQIGAFIKLLEDAGHRELAGDLERGAI